jgi:DedD protein
MGFFSRNKEAADTGRATSVPFETVRRSPRNSRTRQATDTRFDAGSPLDPAETVKTRARRRLIGAVALALVAIVFVPMLFDRAPPAPPDDIALQIPDRDTPFEGLRGVPRSADDASRGPLKPASDLPVVSTTPAAPELPAAAPQENAVEKSLDTDAAKPPAKEISLPRVEKPGETRSSEQAAEKPVEKPVERQVEKPVEKTSDKPKSLTATPLAAVDDPRAIAALEGKSDNAVTTSSVAAGARNYAVQVAAYSAPEKARGMRDQLVAAGFKSYVEAIATPQGQRTRVRLGPFPSRDAADRARAKLKTMKLDGSVVPL